MFDPNSTILLLIGNDDGIDDSHLTKEAEALLDEVGVAYNEVPGSDFRGTPGPWLFEGHTIIWYGPAGIRRFVNQQWWQKAIDLAHQFYPPEVIDPWFEQPNQFFDGQTPTKLWELGRAQEVWGLVTIVISGEPAF